MVSSALVLHRGARLVEREELDRIAAPPATETWFPIRHSHVLDTTMAILTQAGFAIAGTQLALARDDHRFFGVLDLKSPLASGVTLAVGVRNSTDKSFPLGFCAGSKVFVCDNLAFRSELLVRRKHTRFGQERFTEAIGQAVQSLHEFKEAEAERIRRFQRLELNDMRAESLILQGFERGIVSHRALPLVIREWRTPTFVEFEPRTVWSLLNAFTTALVERRHSNPQEYASLTIRLQDLLSRATESPAMSHPIKSSDGMNGFLAALAA
jgi:hypothetical protein